ncbi:MAG: 5-formyltetrahydrofolate cyclo-ligase [Melioribacteraceae bacterium]|jgi:5-formyltetrahydrofolate cyclo-ligase|nr:5-formyltetrahydrofolate cyclo-ligase [Melioribacteraceae bacterium]
MKLKTLISKSEVRNIVLKRRKEIEDIELAAHTKKIIEKVSALDEFVYAKTIHVYISTRSGEVDTRGLINFMEGQGKSIVIPKFNIKSRKFSRGNFIDWDHLEKNKEGYLEPVVGTDDDLSDIDLMIVPAVAVSTLGQRVGYGGGYYDKLLKLTRAPKFVLAFEFQVFDSIETDLHDVRIDKVITERRVISTREIMPRTTEVI